MINGSSAIHNIHTATVTEPHIRATLKNGAFVGSGFSTYTPIERYQDVRSTVFNNKYVLYSNVKFSTTQNILTYDIGGSLHSNTGLTSGLWGASWGNDVSELGRGSFVNTGNTLNLYYLRTGTTQLGITNPANYLTEIRRISSSNGTSWSGVTVLSTTAHFYPGVDSDISALGDSEIYLSGLIQSYTGQTPVGWFNVIQLGYIGTTSKNMYSDAFLHSNTVSQSKGIQCFDFGDERWLLYETGFETINPIKNLNNLHDFSNIKLLRIGITSVYDVRKIAITGSSSEGVHYIYGGLDANSEYAYFGIEQYIKDVVDFQDDDGNVFMFAQSINTTKVICKMDRYGRIYQRSIGIGGTFLASICIGGISSNPTPDLTIVSHNGLSNYLFYPIYEASGSSTDISSDIINYTNNDNRRISLEIGNVK